MASSGGAPETTRPGKKRKYLIVGSSDPVTPDSAAEPRSRHELVAEAAYYKAERRGFVGGDADQDWYEAEAEVDGRPHLSIRLIEGERQ